MGRVYVRDRVRIHRLTKTKDFVTLEQLTAFMVDHLYSLYDMLEEFEEFSDDWEFTQGSIETTEVYLHKAGVEYLDHTAYIEKVDNQKWVKA
jgi:hypothetical protein